MNGSEDALLEVGHTAVSRVALTTLGRVTASVAHLDEHPVALYLSGLSESSRRPQRVALDQIAEKISRGHNCMSIPWERLRYPHIAAIRAQLTDRYAPRTHEP